MVMDHEIREAILYQIGCFITHCVNGPLDPLPLALHNHVADFLTWQLKSMWTSVATKFHKIVQKSVKKM